MSWGLTNGGLRLKSSEKILQKSFLEHRASLGLVGALSEPIGAFLGPIRTNSSPPHKRGWNSEIVLGIGRRDPKLCVTNQTHLQTILAVLTTLLHSGVGQLCRELKNICHHHPKSRDCPKRDPPSLRARILTTFYLA